jgi:WD40 repeat protein
MVSSTPAHSRPIAALKFSHDGRFLASAGADAALRIYSVVEGEAQSVPSSSGASLSRPTPTLHPYAEVLGAHACGINDLVFTYDGRHVLTASDDMTIVVWDLLAVDPPAASAAAAAPLGSSGGAVAPALPTLRPLRSYRGHTSYVFCLAVSALNNMLVSGSYDETVRIWDLKNAKMLRLIKAHSDPVSAVDFNRDGTLIVSSSYDGLWSVRLPLRRPRPAHRTGAHANLPRSGENSARATLALRQAFPHVLTVSLSLSPALPCPVACGRPPRVGVSRPSTTRRRRPCQCCFACARPQRLVRRAMRCVGVSSHLRQPF